MFPQAVLERIGYYVYFLRDPRNKKVFYVGKGKENRLFMHITDSLEESVESDKLTQIREIRKAGLNVEHYVLRHGLSGDVALEIESSLIDFLGLQELHNKVKGHNSFSNGLMTVEDLIELYNAKEVVITDSVIIITVNRYFNRELAPDELYKYTRYCWRVNGKNKAKYVLSTFKGLVREVYEVDSWKQVQEPCSNPKDKRRWYFEGRIAAAEIRDKYLHFSVAKYVGARNPIKYVNC